MDDNRRTLQALQKQIEEDERHIARLEREIQALQVQIMEMSPVKEKIDELEGKVVSLEAEILAEEKLLTEKRRQDEQVKKGTPEMGRRSSSLVSRQMEVEKKRAEDEQQRSRSQHAPQRDHARAEGPVASPISNAPASVNSLGKKVYPYSLLTTRRPPELRSAKLEDHLSDAEFAQVLKMDRDSFAKLAPWRQEQLKRSTKLW